MFDKVRNAFEKDYPTPHGILYCTETDRYTGGHAFGWSRSAQQRHNMRYEAYKKAWEAASQK